MSTSGRATGEHLGTPVASIADAAEVPVRSSLKQRSLGLIEGVRAAAWLTTRLAVVKPLLAAAPAAKAATGLVFEELVQLLPEHMAAEVALILGGLLARGADLVAQTTEGEAFRNATSRLATSVSDCLATAQGEALAVEVSDALLRLLKALKSPPAKQVYDATERAAHAALKLAASPEVARLVTSARTALDAVVELAASDSVAAALREAVDAVADALQHHRAAPRAQQDTLSECDSEDDDPAPPKRRRPPNQPPKTRPTSLAALCVLAATLCWTAFALLGLGVVLVHARRALRFRSDDAAEAPRPVACESPYCY